MGRERDQRIVSASSYMSLLSKLVSSPAKKQSKEFQALPIVHSYFSLLGHLSSASSSDNDNTSEYEPSDDDGLSSTASYVSEGESEAPESLLMPATWQYETIQDEDTFVQCLHAYYDEIDSFLKMDTRLLGWVVKGKEVEVPDAWAAVTLRKGVASQAANLECVLQRFGVQGWDRTVGQMVSSMTAEYRRSFTLACVHQKQVDSLKAALKTGQLEHHLVAFKEWWVAAMHELHVYRVSKDRFV